MSTITLKSIEITPHNGTIKWGKDFTENTRYFTGIMSSILGIYPELIFAAFLPDGNYLMSRKWGQRISSGLAKDCRSTVKCQLTVK